VNVGLYFDLRSPDRDWARAYAFALELCEEADRLGAASVWFSEHHGFDDGYLPQPLTFAAAVAARTSRVRIGTAVLVAPFRHAAHVAEEAAVVDLVSGGRLDLGLGGGYRAAEFALFGADRSRRLASTVDLARSVRRLWAGGEVTPAPAQSRMPFWLGFAGPRGARAAGTLGEGLLSLDPALVAPYREGLAAAGHDPAAAAMAGLLPAYPTDDPERDWPVVGRLHAAQWDSYGRHDVAGTDRPAPRPVDPERSRARGLRPGPAGLLFDTPENVAAAIRDHLTGVPADTVLLWARLPGQDEAMTAAHVRTILTRLAPLLA